MKNLFGKFILTGLIIRGIGFLLNFIFVELLKYQIRPVYFFVMFVDFWLGYFNSRYVVFKTKDKSHKKTLTQFLIAGISFRVLDWFIYIAIVERINFNILLSQFISMVVITLLKFIVLKKIFKS